MKIRTNIRAGQQTGETKSGSSEYLKSVLDGLVSNLEGDVKNLRVWSLIRFKGDGTSNWLLLNQKPPTNKTS